MNLIYIAGRKIRLLNKHVTCTITKIEFKCPQERYFTKEGRIMNKLLGSHKKKRRQYFADTPITPSRGQFSLNNNMKSSKQNSRRIAVLNSLFMEHITDLLVHGDLAQDIIGKGLQISRVAMAPDFNQVNVFWASDKAESLLELEAALPQLAFSLRHRLSQLRVIGEVPRLAFLKDKDYSSALRVDYLLSIADYGDDHAASEPECDFKNLSPPNTSLPQEKSTPETPEEAEALEDAMPLMRHDTFNLDHHKIVNKILKQLHKAKALHRFQPSLEVESEGLQNNPVAMTEGNMSKEDRKEAIARFILSRKILREKSRQNKHKSDSIIKELQEKDDLDDDFEDFKTDDYFDEDLVERQN